ncbi:MAG TPA: ADP-ribosylglycohydrolase family protein [Terriglobia bacterium]|nr:ADP-ribosylglycohydrolase family protein [Terriglobia bacterium]
MLGAIVGDVIGSVHEWAGTKTKDFPLFADGSTFTDDSVLTVAVADWILSGRDLTGLPHDYTNDFPGRGYGGMFGKWARSRSREPYYSFGNGAAMRASPVGFAFETMDEVLAWAERSAEVSHNQPEGIKGAQATAAAIHLARRVRDKDQIRRTIASQFGYDLSRSIDEIRPGYGFNETCQGTVPQALIAFFESTGYEDAIRNAISLGGDADTLACITGGIAEAYYGGVPPELEQRVLTLLDARLVTVIHQFRERFGLSPRIDQSASAGPAQSRGS